MNKLFSHIQTDCLTAFRILFGAVMLWEVYRYFNYDWISRYWINPTFNFKYEGFFWVEPLPGDGMYIVFILLGLLSIFIMIGFLYRISITLFFILFTYTFLLEQARYLNHFYLVTLISFLMIFLPAHRSFSMDAKLFPSVRRDWAPRWTLLLLRFQIGVVYLFGGVAKLNADWLAGSPMDLWLPARSDFPVLGSWFDIPEVILFVSYSGLILDLLAFPLLMYRKTRPWMATALVLFHLLNDRIFSIGIFPWFMIGALILFLPASWPRRFRVYLKSRTLPQIVAITGVALSGGVIACWFHQGFGVVPFLCGFGISALLFWDFQKNPAASHYVRQAEVPSVNYPVAVLLGGWVLLQIIVPLRHFAIPGNPSWTEEGHRFAWHMKLRSKSCDLQFFISNPEASQKRPLNPDHHLYAWQDSEMESRPQLIVQYAKLLSSLYNDNPIFAEVRCSLNGGPTQMLLDPDVDLTRVRFSDWKRNEWVFSY